MKKILKYIFTISVVLSPVLAVYEFLPGTNLAMALLLVFGLLFFFSSPQKAVAQNDEIQLFLTILVLTAISSSFMLLAGIVWFDITLMFHNLWSILLCFLPIVFLVKNSDVGVFIKTAYVMGTIAALVVIWQRLSLIFTGSFYSEVFLPWFDLKRAVDEMSLNRPSAFFSEPAHFTIFMLPIFYMSLVFRRYSLSLLLFFSILCCGSSTGFIMLAIVTVYFLYGIKGKFRVLRIALALAAIILGYTAILLFYPQIIQENIDKIVLMQQGEDNSTTLRLIGPLTYIGFMDGFQLIVGITLNQLEGMLDYKGQYLVEGVGNFANGMIFMFISYGAIGFIMLLRYLRMKWKKIDGAWGFLLIFIGILCSDQILFNAHFLYLTAFVILTNDIITFKQKSEVITYEK